MLPSPTNAHSKVNRLSVLISFSALDIVVSPLCDGLTHTSRLPT
jgi:hypothetical protein